MITCSKIYRDIPLSHRQPKHSGRCSRIHGHSWSITLTFASSELDKNGFVVDFGELHYLSGWIDEHLDKLRNLADEGLLKIIEVNQASCEGIAEFLFSTFDQMVRKNTDNRAWVQKIHLEEDSKNSATFEPEPKR